MATETTPALLNGKELGKELGFSAGEAVRLYKAGAIPAEIAEGRLYRFDIAKVKKALAERAAAKVKPPAA